MSVTLGVIKRHPLKKKWGHEPDFSDWLASDGLDRIAKLVDMDLCEATREVQVGSYKADIVAKEESSGELVLIENQYNTVNHDHLGKLITYAAGIGCKTAILVVEDVRPEAVTTIKWLNEISRDAFAFYLVKAELIQVDDSALAPELTIIEAPDEMARETRARVTEPSDLNKAQLAFWKAFNEHSATRADFKRVFPNARKPQPQHWMDLPCASSAYHIALAVNSKEGCVSAELFIHDDKEIYRTLEASKAKIESECGCSFNWMELPERKASRIVASIPKNWQSAAEQKVCFDWLCDMALKIRKVLVKYV